MGDIDDDLLPISALQHLVYCERQCALIHIERIWAENRFTAEGKELHRRAHSGQGERRNAQQTSRAVPIRSLALGLTGVADVIESDGHDQMLPVEYKRGRKKANDCDRVQLCAQGMCIEEMLGRPVAAGAIFYGQTRRREPVPFTPELRQLTVVTAARLHALVRSGRTPPAELGPKCRGCSLRADCRPELGSRRERVTTYIERALRENLAASEKQGA